MRIAFLADPLDRQYGGIHNFTKEVLNALSKLDKKNEYIIIRSTSKNEFKGIEEIVVPYKSFPGYRFWRLFIQLPKILVKKNIDIVVEPAHFGPFNLPKHIKRVTVIHDMTVFLYPQYHVFLSQYLQRIFLPRILKKSDHIVTNSNSTRQDVVQRFPFVKHKISSFLLGKDEAFQPKIDHSALEYFNIHQPYIVFVGTLEPRKNVQLLIRSFNTFKQKSGLPHQLVLIGKKGWKYQEIFHAIDSSPFKEDILWIGYIQKNDLITIYSMAEVFVYPSFYEGFGLPVLEAMACGVPVITSNVSSLPEVGGSAVKYINPDDEDELSKQISDICSDLAVRNAMIIAGINQAKQFTWDKTAIHFMNLFDSLYP